MNWSPDTQTSIEKLIDTMSLPSDFIKTVQNIYFPLAKTIANKTTTEPLLVSINGAQGTGKSTLTSFVKLILESELNYQTAAFSIDDFYLTHKERENLAQDVHPLLITRGVPGTHDIDLLKSAIDQLKNKNTCRLPLFNKAIDDRKPQSEWININQPVDIILFEGWCNNSPYQTDVELKQPINDLEKNEDENGTWRSYANEQLKIYHNKIFQHSDLTIMLKAPDFNSVYQWRKLQEEKLRANTKSSSNKIIDNNELNRFIQHYERITRHTLKHLPDNVDVLLPISQDHIISSLGAV